MFGESGTGGGGVVSGVAVVVVIRGTAVVATFVEVDTATVEVEEVGVVLVATDVAASSAEPDEHAPAIIAATKSWRASRFAASRFTP